MAEAPDDEAAETEPEKAAVVVGTVPAGICTDSLTPSPYFPFGFAPLEMAGLRGRGRRFGAR